MNRLPRIALTACLLCVAWVGYGRATAITATGLTVQLSGRVTNQSGSGLPGSTIDVTTAGTGTIVGSATTDGNGEYAITLDPGVYDVHVTPPAGSGFGIAVAPGRNVAADTVLDFVLVPAGSVTLSGRVLDGLGHGLTNQNVILTPVGGSDLPTVVTDASGGYSFTVSAGDYHVLVYGYNSDPVNAPHYYYFRSDPISLTGSQVLDIPLPVKRVDVHVQDPSGAPVANVGLSTQGPFNAVLPFGSTATGNGNSSYYNYDPTRTDSAGNATLWLFPTHDPPYWGLYTIGAAPPAGSGLAITNLQNVTVNGDLSLTISLAEPVTLSGRVFDGLGQGLPNQNVILTPVGGSDLPTAVTDSLGSYAFAIAPGDYHVLVYGYNSDPVNAPHYYYFRSDPISLTGSQVLDIPLPVKRVDVHVQDPSGAPVANVGLSTQGPFNAVLPFGSTATGNGNSSYYNYDPTRTDSAGNATLWLFPTHDPPYWGLYTIGAAPPAGSGLAITNLQNVTVNGDLSLTISLAEPVTLSGRVFDGLGQGLPNQNVILTPVGGSDLPTAVTDSLGSYAFAIAPGDYHVLVYGYNSDPVNAPHYYYFRSDPISLTGSQVLDIPLPVKRIGVHVQDLAGHPVPNVALSTQGPFNAVLPFGSTASGNGNSSYYNYDPTRTDSAGNATLWLFPTHDPPYWGLYTITAAPPVDSPFAIFNVQNVTISEDKDLIVVLQFVHDPPVTDVALSPPPGAGGVYTSPVSVLLSATASPGYSVAATYYSLDDGSPQTYAGPFQVTGTGTHTIEYWSIDNSGVFEVPKELSFDVSAALVSGSFFLHGSGPLANPPTLFLDSSQPTATSARYSDSAPIAFAGGNPWKTIGTWSGTPTQGILSQLDAFRAWIGLKNSDDQGTRFDLRAEVSRNGVLVAAAETRCIQGVTRNPLLAAEVTTSFGPIVGVSFNGSTDMLSVKVQTRIGTNPNGSFCGGHSNAVGLRLYFDAVSRPSALEIGGQ